MNPVETAMKKRRLDVFTTLTLTKMALHNGQMPPMMPLTDEALVVCDPRFTPGMGALEADPKSEMLRCPFRGCGKHYHNLGVHIVRSHGADGPQTLRKVLSLPVSAPLRSPLSLRHLRAARPRHPAKRVYKPRAVTSTPRPSGKPKPRKKTISELNWASSCPAQTLTRLLDLRNRLGREPTSSEAMKLDHGLFTAVGYLYGSWPAGLGALVLKTKGRRGFGKGHLLPMVAAFHRVHGRWPTRTEAGKDTTVPVIPAATIVMGALEADSWEVAVGRMVSSGLRP